MDAEKFSQINPKFYKFNITHFFSLSTSTAETEKAWKKDFPDALAGVSICHLLNNTE